MAMIQLETVVSKVRGFFANGHTKLLLQLAAVVFAAGILWAKVASIETQLATLTEQFHMIVHHLLRTP